MQPCVLTRLAGRDEATAYLAAMADIDAEAPFEEVAAKALAGHFTDYLRAARLAGYSDCTPGRFLLPGDLAGSPVLSFAPLPVVDGRPARGTLRREMARRYEAYKSKVVKPFFRDHFARIDRQVVLVDALGAIHNGPPALEDLRQSMADILERVPSREKRVSEPVASGQASGWKKSCLRRRKADHLHHSPSTRRLTAIICRR